MRILFIGGTRFVGRAMADAATARGHEITLLHRGTTGADLFPGATHLLADRDGDLSVLADGEWDATVDVSAYVPGQVRAVARALDGRGGHHVFVSTVSVYAEPDRPDADEEAALLEAAGDDVTEVTEETYGPLKVACERAAAESYGAGLAIVRPTYVVGPHDLTWRYPWWVRRMVRGGEVLAPGAGEVPMQLVDARDLGEFAVSLAERSTSGAFTAARPWFTWSELLEATLGVAPEGTWLSWVDAGWLAERGVTPEVLPLWTGGGTEWSLAMSCARAESAGLRHRPMTEVVADTAAWVAGHEPRVDPGLPAEREAELLEEWRGRDDE